MSSLVDRLEKMGGIGYDAAAEIMRLRADLVSARKALEPFALDVGAVSLSKALGHITRGHLLAAKAALTDDLGH